MCRAAAAGEGCSRTIWRIVFNHAGTSVDSRLDPPLTKQAHEFCKQRIVIRYTAHIALIAYVLGGWLLPTAHHHHAHWDGNHRQGEACPHTHAADAHDGGQPITCHGHDHEQADAIHILVGEHRILAGEASERGCQGLCAICSARSLSSPRLRDGTLSLAATPIARESVITDPHWPILWHSGTHFSRGPPAII